MFHATGLTVIKGRRGTPSRIVVSSDHFPYYPAQIALIDSTGKTISEYWHSGHLDYLAVAELDGRQEIVASGVSNGYFQATLVVLDADKFSGASTEAARPEIQLHGMGDAHERFRFLFPRSDLNRATERYNAGNEIASRTGPSAWPSSSAPWPRGAWSGIDSMTSSICVLWKQTISFEWPMRSTFEIYIRIIHSALTKRSSSGRFGACRVVLASLFRLYRDRPAKIELAGQAD